MKPTAAASARCSRRPKLRGGQQFFDRGELPDALCDLLRAFAEQLIVFVELIPFFVVIDGSILTLLARKPCKMASYFLRGKEASNVANKPRQLPGELGPDGRRINEVQQFLSDE